MELALAPSLEDLLKMLLARSAESPELISLQIWLVQKMDGSLQIAAASGKVSPACSAARIPARTGILGKIVATQRACLKIGWGPAARDFGGGQGGEVGASPQRAVTAEPTQVTGKRSAARRVFAQKARWL